jgi:tRNA (cmo5U34)-methyltransferase
MQDKTDDIVPTEKWKFDKEVAERFDDMLSRSIPSYNDMRFATFEVADRFVRPGTNIIDLGTSCGESVSCLVGKYAGGNDFILCEISDAMIEEANQRFKKHIDEGCVEIRKIDLRISFPQESASVIQSILTLQFIPIEYRQKIIQNVFDRLIPGGAFILVEKVLGSNSKTNDIMNDIYYDLKKHNGYSQLQIDRKKLSLEGVLVPVTEDWNKELLRSAGFESVECIWRWMNFAAWVAIKK